MATATELVSNHDTISRPTSQGCGVERRILFGRWLALQGLCRSFVELSAIGGDEITHSGQEPPLTYRRANPSKLFSGRSAEDLLLASPNWYEERKNRFSFGCSFFRIDRVLQKFVDSESSHHSYDNLVLATGSLAWMPPISHSVLAGVFLYRTDAARYRKIVLPQRHVVGAICGNQWDR